MISQLKRLLQYSHVPLVHDKKFYYIFVFLLIKLYNYTVSDTISKALGATNFKHSFFDLSTIKIISALLIAPILEEIIFRTHLSGKRKDAWSIPVILIVFAIVFWGSGLWIGVIALFLLTLLLIYFKAFMNFHKTKKGFKIIFIVTSVLFAVVHTPIINTDSLLNNLIIACTSMLPLSFFLGYIRFKWGLVYAMLFHSLNNLAILTLNGMIY